MRIISSNSASSILADGIELQSLSVVITLNVIKANLPILNGQGEDIIE